MTASATRGVWSSDRSMAVLGTGSALPGPAVETGNLIACLRQRFAIKLPTATRIGARLGVNTRHISRPFNARRENPRDGCGNADLAARATQAALDNAGLTIGDVDFLIGHTATPGQLLPSNIAFVAERLKFNGPYLELRQACTGFANALAVAQGLLSQPGARATAIVGSETGSLYFDPMRCAEDRGQVVSLLQMGDGAGAIILGQAEHPAASGRIRHVFTGQLGTELAPGLTLNEGGSDRPYVDRHVIEFQHDYALVRASGTRLFTAGAQAFDTAFNVTGHGIRTVDRIIPHQANGRMASLLAPILDVAAERIFIHADRVGNTGSAAIWLAFDAFRNTASTGQTAAVLGVEATKHMFGGFHYVHR